MKNKIAIIVFIIAMISEAVAWGEYDNQLPNGSKFTCLTCHTNMKGNSCNSFGKVTAKYISNDVLAWGPALAALDSDGDGFTNGTELGDPTGSWESGDAAPGIFGSVTNPGSATSKPSTSDVEMTQTENTILIYPNPAVYNITISVGTVDATPGRFDVYDIMGGLVYRSEEYSFESGVNTITWNLLTNSGFPLQSGKYICMLRIGNTVSSQTLVIAR